MTKNTFNPNLPEAAEISSSGEARAQQSSTNDLLFTSDPERSWVDLYAIEPSQPLECCCSEKSQGSIRPSIRRCLEKRITQVPELCTIATLKVCCFHYHKNQQLIQFWKLVSFLCFVSSILNSLQYVPNRYPSSIRQKNSNGRLLVSHDLYAALLDSISVFENLGDFALSFGWKLREHDVGPPPCQFNVGNSWGHLKHFGIFSSLESFPTPF